jgi:hypothetical protein
LNFIELLKKLDTKPIKAPIVHIEYPVIPICDNIFVIEEPNIKSIVHPDMVPINVFIIISSGDKANNAFILIGKLLRVKKFLKKLDKNPIKTPNSHMVQLVTPILDSITIKLSPVNKPINQPEIAPIKTWNTTNNNGPTTNLNNACSVTKNKFLSIQNNLRSL